MTDRLKRSRMMRFAVISSLSGKGLSLVTQLVALPLAVSALGLDRFGIYVMVAALFLWANTASTIVGSSLSLKIVNAHANGDKELETKIFSSAFFFASAAAIILFFVFQFSTHWLDFSNLFSLKETTYVEELKQAAALMSIILPANIIAALSESAQAGYQKQYLNNLLLTAGNVLVIALLVWAQKHPSIAAMVFAVFAPPLMARVVNTGLLWRTKPHLLPKWSSANGQTLYSLIHLGAGFALTQIGSFAYLQYPIISVGREVGLSSAAYFSAMMQVIAISGSLLILFTQPLVPALSDATVRRDFPWITGIYQTAVMRFIPYLALASLAIAFAGNSIISLLLRQDVNIDPIGRTLWAIFFFLVAWEHIGFMFLAGVGKLWQATALYLFGAAIMLLFMHLLAPNYGISGAFAAMCLGPAIATSIAYPYIFRRLMSKNAEQ